MGGNYRSQGLSLYQKGDFAKALETFLIEQSPPSVDPEPVYYMGLCHVRLGQFEDAIRSFTQVLQFDSNIARIYQSWMLLAWLHIKKNDIESAESNLREVLDLGYRSAQVWAALGYCQWRRGQSDKALQSYQEAVSLDAQNSNAANGLGYLLADSGEDPARAIHLCRLALEKDPGNTAYLDSMGWALFKAGNSSEAVRYLTAALTERPGDQTIEGHLEAVRTHEYTIEN